MSDIQQQCSTCKHFSELYHYHIVVNGYCTWSPPKNIPTPFWFDDADDYCKVELDDGKNCPAYEQKTA